MSELYPDIDTKTAGMAAAKLRRKLELKQTDVSRAIDVKLAAINNFEAGRGSLGRKRWHDLFTTLGMLEGQTVEEVVVAANAIEEATPMAGDIVGKLAGQLRHKLGMSQSDAASAIGVFQSALSNFEAGKGGVGREKWAELFTFLGIQKGQALEEMVASATAILSKEDPAANDMNKSVVGLAAWCWRIKANMKLNDAANAISTHPSNLKEFEQGRGRVGIKKWEKLFAQYDVEKNHNSVRERINAGIGLCVKFAQEEREISDQEMAETLKFSREILQKFKITGQGLSTQQIENIPNILEHKYLIKLLDEKTKHTKRVRRTVSGWHKKIREEKNLEFINIKNLQQEAVTYIKEQTKDPRNGYTEAEKNITMAMVSEFVAKNPEKISTQELQAEIDTADIRSEDIEERTISVATALYATALAHAQSKLKGRGRV